MTALRQPRPWMGVKGPLTKSAVPLLLAACLVLTISVDHRIARALARRWSGHHTAGTLTVVLSQCREDTSAVDSVIANIERLGWTADVQGYCRCGDTRGGGEPMRLAGGRALCTHLAPAAGGFAHTFLSHASAVLAGDASQRATLNLPGGLSSEPQLLRATLRMVSAAVSEHLPAGAEFGDLSGYVSFMPPPLRTVAPIIESAGPWRRTEAEHIAAVEAATQFAGSLQKFCGLLRPMETQPSTFSRFLRQFAHVLPTPAEDCCTCCKAGRCSPRTLCCPAFRGVCSWAQEYLYHNQTHCTGSSLGGLVTMDERGELVPLDPSPPLTPASPMPNMLVWAEQTWQIAPEARHSSAATHVFAEKHRLRLDRCAQPDAIRVLFLPRTPRCCWGRAGRSATFSSSAGIASPRGSERRRCRQPSPSWRRLRARGAGCWACTTSACSGHCWGDWPAAAGGGGPGVAAILCGSSGGAGPGSMDTPSPSFAATRLLGERFPTELSQTPAAQTRKGGHRDIEGATRCGATCGAGVCGGCIQGLGLAAGGVTSKEQRSLRNTNLSHFPSRKCQ